MVRARATPSRGEPLGRGTLPGGSAGEPGRHARPQHQPVPALAVLRAMPKVELHLHLDCCLSYAAAAKLSPGLTRGQYEQDSPVPTG